MPIDPEWVLGTTAYAVSRTEGEECKASFRQAEMKQPGIDLADAASYLTDDARNYVHYRSGYLWEPMASTGLYDCTSWRSQHTTPLAGQGFNRPASTRLRGFG